MTHWQKLKRATSEFWKLPSNDLSDFLLDLSGEPGEWMPFSPFGQDSDGLTEFMELYRGKNVGIFLFRSEQGAYIPLHHHKWPERVVFLSGRGTLVYNRDHKNEIALNAERSVLIPAHTLHEGYIHERGLSVCVFYYR